MHIRNNHQRTLAASLPAVGALLDGLAQPGDRLWPEDRWPAMRFDRPLGVDAVGGHGPVRYIVEAYEPGRSIRFRFTAPRGFNGTHAFEVESAGEGRTVLRHSVTFRAQGPALLSWPLVFRPLHDALLEDALDRAERSLGVERALRRWPLRVRVLRRILRRGRRRSES
jgi:hypothetical protein